MRLLSLLFVALALMLSPIGMASGAAAAAPTMVMAGHCAGMDTSSDNKQAPTKKIDCMSICSAVAPAEPAILARLPHARAVDEAAPARMLAGIPPERETPPPRPS